MNHSRAASRYEGRLRRYGIGRAEVDRMLAEQGGSICAICDQPLPLIELRIDHCHADGEVRGLLCNSCNLGLGKFGDDPLVLARATVYLLANCNGRHCNGPTYAGLRDRLGALIGSYMRERRANRRVVA